MLKNAELTLKPSWKLQILFAITGLQSNCLVRFFFLKILSIDFCCLKVTVTGFKSKSLTKIYWKRIALFGNGRIEGFDCTG